MSLTTAEWHLRYLQQARWTRHLRSYLYEEANLSRAVRIMDIGCGTGVLEYELPGYTTSQVCALDIDPVPLNFARLFAPGAFYTLGDGHFLPYADGSFDVTMCHFLLLWIKDVHHALLEMVRVTRANGFILALAEPDYGGRIDYPQELSKIGAWQTAALIQQGANPLIGRELLSAFHRAGLVEVESGVLGGEWRENLSEGEASTEWQVIRSDLYKNQDFLDQADELETLDKTSRLDGERVLFVPTFYAIGMVKG